MSTTPPLYSAPDRSRQRVRLIAAIGMLASTAIAIGGLVALASADEDRPGIPSAIGGDAMRGAEPNADQSLRDRLYTLDSLDSIDALLREVERAEAAASSARAALRRARLRGNIDAEQLDWLERRLDALGTPSAIASPSPAYPPTEVRAPSQAPRSPTMEGPREL